MKGVRIVIRLKKDANSNVVLNTLFKYTPLQSSFSVNNVALVNGRPRTLNLKDLIKYFVKHRHEVVVRRTKFDLEKARKRAHILEGLLKALDVIDEIINIIRSSKNVEEAKAELMARFDFSEAQATAIVEMRLRQLTGLEREKLQTEYDELMKKAVYDAADTDEIVLEVDKVLNGRPEQYPLTDDEFSFNIKGEGYRGKRLETLALQTSRVKAPEPEQPPTT
mgnify:CR=1 FL=1